MRGSVQHVAARPVRTASLTLMRSLGIHFPEVSGHALVQEEHFFFDKLKSVLRIVPGCSPCLSCELELRKEATKLTRERGMPSEASLWHIFQDGEHRMEHRISLLTIIEAPLYRQIPGRSPVWRSNLPNFRNPIAVHGETPLEQCSGTIQPSRSFSR